MGEGSINKRSHRKHSEKTESENSSRKNGLETSHSKNTAKKTTAEEELKKKIPLTRGYDRTPENMTLTQDDQRGDEICG